MRVARVQTESGPAPAILEGENWEIVHDPFAPVMVRTGQKIAVDEARLLAPTRPQIVLGMAHNGFPQDRAKPPQAFTKSARTVTGPGTHIGLDARLGRLDVEGELAVVIGRRAKNLTVDNALDAVFGYTIGNDVTAIEQNPLDDLLMQSKNGENFTPLGPWIETEFDPGDAQIAVHVNGELMATASTEQLARGVAEQLAYITRYAELGPGDVVLGGCPGTNVAVVVGDTVDITISGIGSLSNTIRAASAD